MANVRRDRTVYRTHELRHGIVHAFPDAAIPEMTVLLGDLVLEPGREASFALVYPAHDARKHPGVRVRFVTRQKLPEFIGRCEPTSPSVPTNYGSYPEPQLRTRRERDTVRPTNDRPGRWVANWKRWLSLPESAEVADTVEVERHEIAFQTAAEEGAYIFEIDSGPQTARADETADRFVEYVAVYNKERTSFPTSNDEDEDLAELIVHAVNLSRKNGLLWFVHPIYFVEQFLNVRLSDTIKREIADCEDLPDDLPASDDKLVQLQWGRDHGGIQRICLDLDAPAEECVKTDAMRVVDNPVDLLALLRRRDER